MNRQKKKADIVVLITNWCNAWHEPIGINTLATGLAGHWHEEVWFDDLHDLLKELENECKIKDVGHWRYQLV